MKSNVLEIKKQKMWLPQSLVSLMLLWALNPSNPYGYYILLRWVCCGCFAYMACAAYEQKKQNWVWILGITAIIYNPIIKVHLTREIWSFVNVITIGIALVSIFILKSQEDNIQ